MKPIKSLILLFLSLSTFAQQKSNQKVLQVYYSDNPLLNMVLEKTDLKEDRYSLSYPFSSCNLYFYKDGTFVFYYVDIVTYEMAVGRFADLNGIRVLNSDSAATAKAVNDPEFYNKYFKFKKPSAMTIENSAYVLDVDQLVPYHNSIGLDKIELLYSTRDFLGRKLQMKPFKGIHYDLSGKKILVDFEDKIQMSLPIDSLWGFIIFKQGELKIYRTTPKGFNWYSFPGARVVQTDPFIIYTVGDGRLYNYFSRDLSSKIYPLEHEKLRKEFGANPAFMEALLTEIPPHRSLSLKGKTTNSYRVLEIYKETIVADTSRVH